MGAVMTALIVSFIFGPRFIKFLKKKQKEGQPIRDDGPENHLVTKKGTPTMGGVLILGSITFSCILWGNWQNAYLWIVLGITLGFGFLGALDDYKKLTKRTHHGISARLKFICQSILSVIVVIAFAKMNQIELSDLAVGIPFFKNTFVVLGYGFFLWAILVIVGSSNAVNLTDGLDGLAIVPVMITAACFAIITYVVGHVNFANYLQLVHIPKVSELCIFLGSLIGAGLGFLWFNAPPARVFMGDTGSLATGGAIGSIALLTMHELVLAVIGGLFVVEALSVIIQVGYFKLTKKRIFLMAPIHHHFEKKGWSEPTIVIRFWIIATVLGILGLTSLKLR